MKIRRNLIVPCGPDELFAWVDDLAQYPRWMQLVHHVQLLDDDGPGDDRAWQVELQARVGPFARSKSLRMVRTEHDVPRTVTFDRIEVDGRSHSSWRLRATIGPAATPSDGDLRDGDLPDGDQADGGTVGADSVAGTGLTMELHYGGVLWTGAVLERVLDDAVRRGSDALIELVKSQPTR